MLQIIPFHVNKSACPGGASPYVPPVPGHGQFSDQISVKTYVVMGSFNSEMCPRKLGHAQFQKRDSPPVLNKVFCKKQVVICFVYLEKLLEEKVYES